MVDTLRYLLRNSIDYAGLFPPAELPVSAAVPNYLKYRSGPESWFLGRFVSPALRLAEVDSALYRIGYGDLFPVCVIGRGGQTTADFLANTMADVVAARRSGIPVIEAFEAPLPKDLLGSSDLGAVVRRVARYLEQQELYLEVPFSDNWKADVPKAIETIKKTGVSNVKIRTGGLVASAFPTVEQTALFIYECAKARLPFKATAGLHHPVRAYREETKCEMHGFLNVFVASAVAATFAPSLSVIEEIIAQQDPAAFQFVHQRLRYGAFHFSTQKIKQSRELVLSFGSCSVAEPIEDLDALGHSLRRMG